MADNTRSSWDAFLLEMRGEVQRLFPQEAVFLAELSGFDQSDRDAPASPARITKERNRDVFSGRHVRHTIVPQFLQGGGFVTETGSWNRTIALDSEEVHIKLTRAVQPVGVTIDLERDSMDNSMAESVAELFDSARIALAHIENVSMLGDGTGLLAAVTGAGGSPGLAVPVGTSANFDLLLPGMVVDVLTRASGANPGNGLRRKIASVDEAAGTVTFDTAAQAADGDSGNITFSANEGIYIAGSWSNGTGDNAPGAKVMQGLEQAAAATGTFENLDKAANAVWQGTDGRAGDTATAPLSLPMLDKAVRQGRRAGIYKWDFGIGDPAVIDLYKQGLYNQARYDIQETKLKSGFSGVVADIAGAPFPLIGDPEHGRSKVHLVNKSTFKMYGDKAGPDFLDDDGGIFRRFERALPKEAELLDRVQMGVVSCNRIVRLYNLSRAA